MSSAHPIGDTGHLLSQLVGGYGFIWVHLVRKKEILNGVFEHISKSGLVKLETVKFHLALHLNPSHFSYMRFKLFNSK